MAGHPRHPGGTVRRHRARHPGFGASDVPDRIDDVSDVAYFYLDAIEALGLSGIHVVGQSLGVGSRSKWRCARRRLRQLTLISAAGIHVEGVPRPTFSDRSGGAGAPRLRRSQARRGGRARRADKYQDLAVLNRIASARFGWQPRFFNRAWSAGCIG
jgi:pimeloyl-ACP methyl ester carboxylesterase